MAPRCSRALGLIYERRKTARLLPALEALAISARVFDLEVRDPTPLAWPGGVRGSWPHPGNPRRVSGLAQ